MGAAIALAVATGGPAVVQAQEPPQGARFEVVRPEENFRQEPRGTKLATVLAGAPLRVVGERGSWREAVLEGWVWSPSLAATNRDGFDLLVSKTNGENLRDTPSVRGRRLAVLLRGMLLERVERSGNWLQVRRTAWIWGPSLAEAGTSARPADAAVPVAAGEESAASGIDGEDRPDRIVVGPGGARLHVAPDGDTLGRARPGADLEVMRRDGNWARVRMDGWIWLPSTLPADSATLGEGITPAVLVANPEQYRGRSVRWTAQFISLEQAETVRSDFYEGEPFILARSADPAQGFLYLAVPPELLAEVELLRPLQSIQFIAKVRTGRSALMGAPVLDLVALE